MTFKVGDLLRVKVKQWPFETGVEKDSHLEQNTKDDFAIVMGEAIYDAKTVRTLLPVYWITLATFGKPPVEYLEYADAKDRNSSRTFTDED